MRKILWTLALVLAVGPASRGDEDKEKKIDLPVKAKLVAVKAAYVLDLNGKTAAEFKKVLKAAEENGNFPNAPKVDLVLEITNTTEGEIKIWTKGDPVTVTLEVKGPGAVSVDARRAFTREFRIPTEVGLLPGKTIKFPISSLQYGFRGVAKQAYWTEAGEYSVTATLNTGISPAPKGSKDAGEGFGQVAITSQPVKVKVEEK